MVFVRSQMKKCYSGLIQKNDQTFEVDEICDQDCTQADAFAKIGLDLADLVLRGFNSTILAYGQTGSGKTYTMQGCGDVPGLCLWMFSHLAEQAAVLTARGDGVLCACTLSCEEVYNDTIIPILADAAVRTAEDVFCALAAAHAQLHFGRTAMNARSSRSHFITTFTLTRRHATHPPTASSLTMVDLAGSERVKSTRAAGVRLREATHVNRSLLALGAVIAALAARAPHVPYRASRLTRLLASAVGGAARLCVLAHVSPLAACRAETVATLRFVAFARTLRAPPPPPPLPSPSRRAGRRRRTVRLAAWAGARRAAPSGGGGGGGEGGPWERR
jgi:kinesin family protein 15